MYFANISQDPFNSVWPFCIFLGKENKLTKPATIDSQKNKKRNTLHLGHGCLSSSSSSFIFLTRGAFKGFEPKGTIIKYYNHVTKCSYLQTSHIRDEKHITLPAPKKRAHNSMRDCKIVKIFEKKSLIGKKKIVLINE